MLVMSSLHLLCFGNSITAGWTELGIQWHPYAVTLLDGLGKSVPGIDFTADVQGAPGDRVVSPPGGYLPRMDILCKLFFRVRYSDCLLYQSIGKRHPGAIITRNAGFSIRMFLHIIF